MRCPGVYSNSCGITLDRDAVCWGTDTFGSAMPPAGTTFIAIDGGDRHLCGITVSNDAVCWGANEDGQVTPPRGRKFIAVSAAALHSCAITLDNDAVCWGTDTFGSTMPPADKLIAISSGDFHNCGITYDNRAVCWGDDKDSKIRPPERKFIAVAAGSRHSCGITVDNGVVCWGGDENERGETVGQSSPPQIIPTAADPIAITAMASEADREQISVSGNGQTVVPAGETQATLTVTAIDDDIKEPDITYIINSDAEGHAVLTENQIAVTVVEDDRDTLALSATATVTLADDSLAEGDSTILTARLEDILSAAATLTLSHDDGLIIFSDKELVFAQGDTETAITVAAINNNLANASTRTATITIVSRGDNISPVIPDSLELSVEPGQCGRHHAAAHTTHCQ